MNKQTEALKMAIEALERVDRWLQERHMGNLTPLEKDALQACKEALEQPAQEPVATLRITEQGEYSLWLSYETEEDYDRKTKEIGVGEHKLYTHPAPSWQGLSDDEIWDIANFLGKNKEWDYPVMFAKTIEKALKEKNHEQD